MDPEEHTDSDEAFLDEVFDLAVRCRSTGESFDLEEVASRRPHLRERVVRTVDLAQEIAVSSPPPAPGHRFGHYRILEQIGRGGQATVYLAQDTHLDRKVALKILDPAPGGSRQTIERFTREAEITSRLDHPGICVVYDSGESGGSFWIAMRYVDGESLAHKIGAAKARPDSLDPEHQTGPRTPIEIAELLTVFEKVVRALHVAHEQGVIHRDIKPGNIMINREGEPVILDFGLAHEMDGGGATLTLTGALIGTPAYMSPEQVASQSLRLDRRTDVYSLGVSLYECLTLDRPFEAPTREGLYQAILTKAPPDVRVSNHSVSKDLKVVLETAMEKDRDRRYQTALDLAQDLERVRKHEPIVAKPIGPIGRLERWARRNPALATAVAGLFAVLTIGLGIALFLLAQRDQALGEKSAALSEKSAALSDYDRLGDWSRFQRLEAEYEKLWPCEPSMVPAMKAWLNQAEELEQRLPGHRGVLDRLRRSKGLLPYTDEDRAADFQAHDAERTELDLRRRQLARLPSELAGTTSRGTEADEEWRRKLPFVAPTIERIEYDIQRLERSIEERLTWKFGTSAEQFKHDTTSKLVSQLTTFVDREPIKGGTALDVQKDPKPWMVRNVRARLAFAESVESNTIGKYRAEWAEAIRSIADQSESPAYRGLKITPQPGLIPIGKDPVSGLWEFMNLITSLSPTEPIPKRDTGGRLVVTESMGLVFVLIPGGKFRMGAIKPDEDQALSEPNVDPDVAPPEAPITDVELEPFFISKYEMMEIQWFRITQHINNSYALGRKVLDKVVTRSNPVETVSWQECDLWLTRLGLVLPTEAQWEYAARGGTTTPRWTGIGTDDLAKAANVRDVSFMKLALRVSVEGESWDDGYAVHAPVGSFAPNPFGLHDVLGNVAEWCRDEFIKYEDSPRLGDGLRLPTFLGYRQRVTRGGHYLARATEVRSAARSPETADIRNAQTGVRPAMALRRD